MKKNLIIGAIKKYSWEDIMPFFESLKKVNIENCDIVMFVEDMTNRTLKKLHRYGVNTINTPKQKIPSINDYRWGLYSEFIGRNIGKYSNVFTADVRDTIFQRNVFLSFPNEEFIYIAHEEENIEEENFNKNWLIMRYGEKVYNEVSKNKIICTGTVAGSAEEFCAFATEMNNEICSARYTYFQICDQATGNELIYHQNKFLNNLLISENNSGPIMTIGLSTFANLEINSENEILLYDGTVAPIVHQYDRHSNLVELVRKKYCINISFVIWKILSNRYTRLIYRKIR